jgi:hypothetical protein
MHLDRILFELIRRQPDDEPAVLPRGHRAAHAHVFAAGGPGRTLQRSVNCRALRK